MVTHVKALIKSALGEEKADLLIKGVKLVNVATSEVYEADISIKRGFIVSLMGNPKGARIEVDAKSLYAVPCFIDGHVHVESSHLTITGFAEAVVPKGTAAAVFDPHEVANVLGIEGVLGLISESTRGVPFKAFFMAPSCVPSAPGLETSGAKIGVREIQRLLRSRRVLGLAEVMNYPGILSCDENLLKKVHAARRLNKLVDGHCPKLRGYELAAYISSGPRSDHEALTAEEVVEKLRNGLWVMIREGSASKMLDKVLPTLIKLGMDLGRVMIVTDDVDPRDLINGHLDLAVRKAIRLGLDPIEAFKLVTLNPSMYFKLEPQVGLIAPGWEAHLILLNDLQKVEAVKVMVAGKIVAANGKIVSPFKRISYPQRFYQTVSVKRDLKPEDFAVKAPISSGKAKVRAIVVEDGSLLTRESRLWLKVEEGKVLPDPSLDVLQVGVVERHGLTGSIGLGFVQGLGLRRGAIATTYAHDSHNLVVVGADWRSMYIAATKVIEMQGGIAVVEDDKLSSSLRLELAGLMSSQPVDELAKAFTLLHDTLRLLGCKLSSPLTTLSFITLPVIPELKITDRGLVDVNKQAIVSPIIDYSEE